MRQIPQENIGSPNPKKRQETVLVTGGSGHLTGWIVVQLLQQGYQVRTTLRSLSRADAVRSAVAGQTDLDDRLSFAAADLLKDGGWDDAVRGCDYVLHVASPMGRGEPKADLVRPAREGTTRVLKASWNAGVRRVVLTSSAVAAKPSPTSSKASPKPTDESTWTDPEEKGLSEYERFKTLAERAAWEYAEQTASTRKLTTILPGLILGPVMTTKIDGTVEIVSRMLEGRVPALPRVGFSIVGVRDLADLHIRAMLAAVAEGQRFLAVGDFLWMAEIAKLLRDNFGQQALKVPTRRLPDFAVRLAGLFQQEARFMAALLGKRTEFDVSKAAKLLDWHPRPAADIVLECASDLTRQHLV